MMMKLPTNASSFKAFRDNDHKLIITYWVMNAGDTFTTCDLLTMKIKRRSLDKYKQIEDYGCTFLTQGKCSLQIEGSDEILECHPGEVGNRRRQDSILITALEDNTLFCYCLHFDSLFTTDETKKLDRELENQAVVLTGESIKISIGETIELFNANKDIYIANPIFESEPNTISYKKTEEEDFTSLDFGKYLKIEKGTRFMVKSTIDTYIPKIYYTTN